MGKEINQVVAKLSSIEESAVSVVNSSDKQKTAYAAEIEKKTKDFDDNLAKETEAKLAQIKQELTEKSKQELTEWRKTTEGQFSRIDQEYSAHHAAAAKKIFEQLIAQ